MPDGTTSPLAPSLGDTVEKALSLHIVSLKLFICGTGFTVIVNVNRSPILDTFPFVNVGITVIVVINGSEVGGGSIRIHKSEMQKTVLKLLGIEDEEAREKFGFLLDALDYGCPPHGGIASVSYTHLRAHET